MKKCSDFFHTLSVNDTEIHEYKICIRENINSSITFIELLEDKNLTAKNIAKIYEDYPID